MSINDMIKIYIFMSKLYQLLVVDARVCLLIDEKCYMADDVNKLNRILTEEDSG